MVDLPFVVLGVGAFGVLWVYALLCERL